MPHFQTFLNIPGSLLTNYFVRSIKVYSRYNLHWKITSLHSFQAFCATIVVRFGHDTNWQNRGVKSLHAGVTPWMRPANERRRYIVTSSLILLGANTNQFFHCALLQSKTYTAIKNTYVHIHKYKWYYITYRRTLKNYKIRMHSTI